jgi:hypothetical protein
MKISIIITLLLLTVIPISFCFANPGDTLWTRIYGPNGNSAAQSVKQTADGGYIMAGSYYRNSAGEKDFYVVKTDSEGDIIWTKFYGGTGCEEAYSVQQTTDGGYIIAGLTIDFDENIFDYYLVKTDPDGDTLWTRTNGGNDYYDARAVQQTMDGGYVIAGMMAVRNNGLEDFYLVKTDAYGNMLWSKTYGGNNRDMGQSVWQNDDGGYIIAGYTNSFGAGDYDFYLVRAKSNGDTIWTRTYGGTQGDLAQSVQQTADGGFIVAGSTFSFGAGSADVYLIKTNADGDTVWTRTYGDTCNDWGYSVQQTMDHGYIIAGCSRLFYSEPHDFYLIKTDAFGNTIWTRRHDKGGNDVAYSVIQTDDGGYAVAGFSNVTGVMNCLLMKIEGTVIGIEDDSEMLPLTTTLHQSYPNPFNASTTIRYQLAADAEVKLSIYNLLGRKVANLVDTKQPAGKHEVRWDASGFSSGIYFYKLTAGEKSTSRRMVLLK